MELTIYRSHGTTEATATPENLVAEVQNAYEGSIEAVILVDLANNSFMQTDDGQHIEYQVDLTHYFVDNVSLETATKLFLCFAENDPAWKFAVDWKIDVELTEIIRSSTDARHENVKPHDLDSDFEYDSDGILRWTVPIDVWAPQSLDAWRRLIMANQRKLDNKSVMYRGDWTAVVRPIWDSHPLPGERHWRDQLRPVVKQEFDVLVPVAEALAVKMEASFWERKVRELNGEPISNISSMRRMLRDTLDVNNFLVGKKDDFPELEKGLRQVKERFAWYRAKKKADDAEIAEALGQKRKSEKLRIEAGVMLRQDWREVFVGEEVPKEESAKIGQTCI